MRRFYTVDFAHLSAVQGHTKLKLLRGTYDIACQYTTNFDTRVERHFPPSVVEQLQSIATATIPKLVMCVGRYHEHMHTSKCRPYHSLHYRKGSSRDDGEGPERNWGPENGHSLSTKEQSFGHRQDDMNGLYHDRNTQRVHRMRKCFQALRGRVFT